MEEIFFFLYHMRVSRNDCMKLAIPERRFLIERFTQQKEKEHDEYEKESRKAKQRKK